VIVGRLIPAGTGLAYHRARQRSAQLSASQELQALEDQNQAAAASEEVQAA
jgi:DNA-directed RNA polymerase subunit beta'